MQATTMLASLFDINITWSVICLELVQSQVMRCLVTTLCAACSPGALVLYNIRGFCGMNFTCQVEGKRSFFSEVIAVS